MTFLRISVMLVACLSGIRGEAAAYDWPVITNIWTVMSPSGGAVEVYGKWTKTRVVDEKITTKDTVGDVLSRNGVDTGSGHLSLGPAIVATRGIREWGISMTGLAPDLNLDDLFIPAINAATNKLLSTNGFIGEWTVGGGPGSCVYVGLSAFDWYAQFPSATSANAHWMATSWSPGGMSCFGVPPTDERCFLEASTVDFRFGTITASEAEGTTLTEEIIVNCSTKMAYNLSLTQGGDAIALSNGGSAVLHADGKELDTLKGLQGKNSVMLSATLKGPIIKAGSFEGQGVLYISYP